LFAYIFFKSFYCASAIGRLEAGVSEVVFLRWTQQAVLSLSGEQVCVNGKSLRGSRGNKHSFTDLHRFSEVNSLIG